jgi:hypothetical protein
MTLQPARNALLLIVCFVIVIAVIFMGAWFYKYSGEPIQNETDMATTEETSTTADIASGPPATLSLVSTGSSNEYQLVLANLTMPVTTIAFQLQSVDPGTAITGSSIKSNSELEQSNWTTVINTESSSETGQTLSFSLARLGVNESQTIDTIVLGTIQLNEGVTPTDIQINKAESFVTYSGTENPVRIVFSTVGSESETAE